MSQEGQAREFSTQPNGAALTISKTDESLSFMEGDTHLETFTFPKGNCSEQWKADVKYFWFAYGDTASVSFSTSNATDVITQVAKIPREWFDWEIMKDPFVIRPLTERRRARIEVDFGDDTETLHCRISLFSYSKLPSRTRSLF